MVEIEDIFDVLDNLNAEVADEAIGLIDTNREGYLEIFVLLEPYIDSYDVYVERHPDISNCLLVYLDGNGDELSDVIGVVNRIIQDHPLVNDGQFVLEIR